MAKPPLIIFLGECNACGFLSKSGLKDDEKGILPQVMILNNLTLKVEPLDMQRNNFLQHASLHDNRSYGWEVMLAKQASQKRWATDPVYLVKGGQGGTRAMHFRYNMNGYYTIFLMRIRAMENQLGPHTKVIWYQQGANEPKEPPEREDFKACVKKLFKMIREDLGTFPIIMTKMLPASLWLNPCVEEIAREDPGIKWVDTEEVNKTCRDPQHWDMKGMEIMADLLCKATNA